MFWIQVHFHTSYLLSSEPATASSVAWVYAIFKKEVLRSCKHYYISCRFKLEWVEWNVHGCYSSQEQIMDKYTSILPSSISLDRMIFLAQIMMWILVVLMPPLCIKKPCLYKSSRMRLNYQLIMVRWRIHILIKV